jgi:solute carrier family 25 protein 39/40
MPSDMFGKQRASAAYGKELVLLCKRNPSILILSCSISQVHRVIGVPSSTAYILTYDHLLNVTLPTILPTGPALPLFAGILARSAITSTVSPLELIRTNLQSTPLSPNQPHSLRSVLTSVHNVVQRNGVSFLWRGLGPTLWRDVPFSGVYWASYEAWKGYFASRGREGAPVAFVSGATSGILAALITSPFDVLKTRRQALLMSESTTQATRTIPLLLRIIRMEGFRALYVGNLPRIAKIAPACGIMISCYEVCPWSPWHRSLFSDCNAQGIGRLLARPSA